MFELLRAVVDTNVFISAFLSSRGAPAIVVEAARREVFRALTAEPLLDELERNLVKLDVPTEFARRQRERVARSAEMVLLRTTVTFFPPSHGDNLVLTTAVDGHARYLVTGDKKHLLPLREYQGVQIVTPRDFLTVLTQGGH